MSGAPSLLAGLSPDEIAELDVLIRRLRFAAGTEIFHEGQPADGMMILRAGRVDLHIELPGGEQTPLGRLGPGDVLGELSLLAASHRSATALAVDDVEVDVLERRDFLGLRHALRPSSFQVMRALARHMGGLLQNADARTRAADPVDLDDAYDQPPLGCREQPGGGFDPRPFLSRLPFFRGFSPSDLDELLDHGTLWQLPRGRVVLRQGDASPGMFAVVRGAVEVLDQPGLPRLALVGPGGLVGQLSPLLDTPPIATCRMREAGTVLQLDPAALDVLLRPTDRLAYRFLDALCEALLADVRRANRVLAWTEGTRRLDRR